MIGFLIDVNNECFLFCFGVFVIHNLKFQVDKPLAPPIRNLCDHILLLPGKRRWRHQLPMLQMEVTNEQTGFRMVLQMMTSLCYQLNHMVLLLALTGI